MEVQLDSCKREKIYCKRENLSVEWKTAKIGSCGQYYITTDLL